MYRVTLRILTLNRGVRPRTKTEIEFNQMNFSSIEILRFSHVHCSETGRKRNTKIRIRTLCDESEQPYYRVAEKP